MTPKPELKIPQGFRAEGLRCGIKETAERKDLSLFVSDVPASAAGVFAQNRVVGAPVKVSRERVPAPAVRAVVINSGNANACTGDRGMNDARWMTDRIAEQLACPSESVLVCSTGIIGHFLPREALESGLDRIANQARSEVESFVSAAEGMMTTDTFSKTTSRSLEISGNRVTVFGAAKGAAMIAPNMATMLAVVLTDATLTDDQTDRVLRHSVNDSFNCISVDGHQSTSDSVLLLANGEAGCGVADSKAETQIVEAVRSICQELAQAIIRDGEGAEHFVTVRVEQAANRSDALQVAREVAESALVKTAITGNDPNWGRIVSAVGYSGIDIREEQISLSINGIEIYRSGAPTEYDEPALSKSMREDGDVLIELKLDSGEASIDFWTTDLTAEYVRLNSEYTT